MNVRRGDVVLVLYPFASGRSGSRRPVLIEQTTPEGQQAGLLHDSVVSCTNLATVHEDRIDRVIGHLPESAMRRLDECLKTALGLLS